MSMVDILKNKYLPFLLAIPFFFCMHRYDGVVFDAILYVTQYVYSVDPARFAGDPAFAFGNQDSFGFFSPILGLFLETFGVSFGAFVYTILMQFAWIVALVCLVKSLMGFIRQRLWILPVTILTITFFANGMAFSKIHFFNYVSLYACSRSLSIALGIGALALLFSKKKIASLILILAGTAIHPLTAGWCLPFWLFYFFPKTKWPIVVASLIFPFSGFLHFGGLDFLQIDWLERPLEFLPDYVFFSKFFVLLSFFGIIAKWSPSPKLRKISISLVLLMAIMCYWNVWGGIGEHVFLYQVQPWRAIWVPSIIAVPLGICFIKDSFRQFIKKRYFTTRDFSIALLTISFLAPANLVICSIASVVFFVNREMRVSLKIFVLVFASFFGAAYLLQQYFTWCLQGFPSFGMFDYLRLCRIRDTFLLYQLFFTIVFVVFFLKQRRFFLAVLMLSSILYSRYMLFPALPLFMYFFPKKNRVKYWGGVAFVLCLIIFDGLFDTESRRASLIEGMPLNFPKICCASAMFFISFFASKKLSFWGLGLWFVLCCIVSYGNYNSCYLRWVEKESQLDQYLHQSIFPQIKERGKILFYVSGDYDSEPRLRFFTGSYLSHSSMVGALFNYNHYQMALKRSHLLYKKSLDSESMKYYDYSDIVKKIADVDTLVDRTMFLCEKKEIMHLVTDKNLFSLAKDDSAMVGNSQKVFLYGCPSTK